METGKKAKAIHICGTGSGVGKSVIVTGICRLFLNDRHDVAPFKAQNMALNSFVTKEDREIGRAQAVQAQACRIEPSVLMNPVLIKPSTESDAQIILHGKPLGNMKALQYTNYKKKLLIGVRESYDRLSSEHEIIVLEGAGSPAEINLKANDIVNLKMAGYADAPVILVGDIDKGGVFAWIVGTLALLTKSERKMVKGIIINKFRGDIRQLKPAIDFLETKTDVKVLGVIPYFKNIKIPEEDEIPKERYINREENNKKGVLDIAVILLPHISNFTDFDALENEPDVNLRYVKSLDEFKSPDIIIIPGTKNTISDLIHLKETGIDQKILSEIESNESVVLVGICGGFQMLGIKIMDNNSIESINAEIDGLGVLPIETELKIDKRLSQVKATEIDTGLKITGYEIHHGKTTVLGECDAIFRIKESDSFKKDYYDGAVSKDGRIMGTYIHGLFDTDLFRRDFLNRVRKRKGWNLIKCSAVIDYDNEYDKLAKLIKDNIDVDYLYKILNKEI